MRGEKTSSDAANPFLRCPSCGSAGIAFEEGKLLRCSSCGFLYFHNVAAAAGLIVSRGSEVLFIRRAAAPSSGLLALPGGFVNPDESAEHALRRECEEEISWIPEEIHFLASFPNRYEYRSVVYNTCDLFFYTKADALREEQLSLDPAEASAVTFVNLSSLRPEDLAFESTRKAIDLYRTLMG